MFPIINLDSQLNSINRLIKDYKLELGDIYFWLSMYGTLVKPSDMDWLKNQFYYNTPLDEQSEINMLHAFISDFGFVHKFWIDTLDAGYELKTRNQ